jgi:putative nucleotidyltransferase with HDIG domain
VSAIYRVQQFVRAARAWVQAEEVDEAWLKGYLAPAAVDLFRAMPRYDQQHALNVVRTLQEHGHTEPDLLAAALLHDVGKSVSQVTSLHLWHRVAWVLIRAFAPGLLAKIGQDRPGSWRQPFFVQQHHAVLGAEMAQQAGCSPVTVELIRRHEDAPAATGDAGQSGDPLLAALLAADGVN